jgi:hypothetical protein
VAPEPLLSPIQLFIGWFALPVPNDKQFKTDTAKRHFVKLCADRFEMYFGMSGRIRSMRYEQPQAKTGSSLCLLSPWTNLSSNCQALVLALRRLYS